jgi:hypothetical protein
MPERNSHPTALAAWSSPVAADHLRGGRGLVEEHEPVWIKIELSLEPGKAGCLHVVPILLGRVAGVFLRVMPWRLKKRDRLLTPTRRPRSASRVRSSRRNNPGCASSI